jgi:hypothetical protein
VLQLDPAGWRWALSATSTPWDPIVGDDWDRRVAAIVPPPAPRVDVQVDAGLARLIVLPYHDALVTPARWHGHALSALESSLNAPADGWTLRVVPERPPRPRLAVALPTALLGAVARRLGGAPVRVGTLLRLDRLRRRSPRFSGVAIDICAGGLIAAVFEVGVLQRLRWRRAVARAPELASLWRVEWTACGHGALPAMALPPSFAPLAAEVAAGVPVLPLD